MSTADLLIIVVMILSILYGFRKGLISQIGSVGGFVVGILACRLFGDHATAFITSMMDNADGVASGFICSAAANILLFVIGYSATALLARAAKTVARTLCLGVADRVAGSIFCLFAWTFFFSLALNLAQIVMPSTDIYNSGKFNDGRMVKSMMDLSQDVLGGASAAQLFD